VLLMTFVLIERAAPEPVLPLRLFAVRAFTVSGLVGFIVGLAMFGSLTFLPLFMQSVKEIAPTTSGMLLVAMMGGLLFTSITSGRIISRIGRYKIFPIVGTAIFTLGLFLLSTLDERTNVVLLEVYIFVLGFGIGMVMQVLVIAVQNAVDYRDLGAATSGVTFFRSMGSSFGVAIFGAIFSNVLLAELQRTFGAAAGANLDQASSLSHAIAQLPPAVHVAYVHAYAAALHPVFFTAGCVGIAAFALAWLLPETALRTVVKATDLEETFAMPLERTSAQEIERALSFLATREGRVRAYTTLAEAAGVDAPANQCWLLIRLGQTPPRTPEALRASLQAPPEALARILGGLRERRFVEQNGVVALTAAGRTASERLQAARRALLERYLADWPPDQRAQMQQIIVELAQRLLSENFAADLEAAKTTFRSVAASS
jgi:MFS family permease